MFIFLGIVLKIISSTFYLFSGIIWKKVIRRNINYRVIFYRSIFSIASTLLAILVFSKMEITDYSLQDFKNGIEKTRNRLICIDSHKGTLK